MFEACESGHAPTSAWGTCTVATGTHKAIVIYPGHRRNIIVHHQVVKQSHIWALSLLAHVALRLVAQLKPLQAV